MKILEMRINTANKLVKCFIKQYIFNQPITIDFH